MRDFATVLETTLNTGALTPGTYELAYRQRNADWRLLPLQVK